MKGLVRLIIKGSLAAVLSAAAAVGYGQDPDSLWQRGNDAYSIGEYGEALSAYRAIEAQGYESALLYYNMGNACYKLKENGRAILYYERSLKLDPSGRDAENNLQIARQFTLDKIDAVPEFILSTWTRRLMDTLSSDQWAYLGIALLAGMLLLLLAFRFAPSAGARKAAFALACAALLAVIVFLSFSFSLRHRSAVRDRAVVMVPVSSIKSAPNATGNNVFILHEGTVVQVLEELGSWSRIELSDGRQGWISTGDMEVI